MQHCIQLKCLPDFRLRRTILNFTCCSWRLLLVMYATIHERISNNAKVRLDLTLGRYGELWNVECQVVWFKIDDVWSEIWGKDGMVSVDSVSH